MTPLREGMTVQTQDGVTAKVPEGGAPTDGKA